MGRGAIEATTDIDGTSVTVVTAHFKSKLISYTRQQGVIEGAPVRAQRRRRTPALRRYAVYLRTAEAMT